MRFLLKILLFSSLLLVFHDSLQAQRKYSRKTMNLPSNAIRYVQHPRWDTVIVKGSEVNWSFVFCEATTYLEIEGVGRTNMKDIKAGEWHITTRPTKTTTYIVKKKNTLMPSCIEKLTVKVVDTEAEIKKVWDEMWKEKEEKIMKDIEGAPTPEIKQILLKRLKMEKRLFYERIRGNIPTGK